MRVWERTDRPVVDNVVSRTWMWGPEAFTPGLMEEYAESPDGSRRVQYFDKSRMEITHPDAVDDGRWYVTNGLLVVELISGRMQLGDNTFEQLEPAQINVAGDPNTRPTYADFRPLLGETPLTEGEVISWRMNEDGTVDTSDPGGVLAGRGVAAARFVPQTNHTVAEPFWTFMNSSGMVYQEGQIVEDSLFFEPFYATGFPITEAYWTTVNVGGTPTEVLIQCFERRCLTYTPENDPGWQVEAGNVGRHYYQWRYDAETFCIPAALNHKDKTDPTTKLTTIAANTQVPSVLAGAFFQFARRYLSGTAPTSDLESRIFASFDQLPVETRQTLQCSLGKLDALPGEQRDRLIDPGFGRTADAISNEILTAALGEEISQRMSQALFGETGCLDTERSGAVRRYYEPIDGVLIVTPRVYRINGLRTEAFEIALGEYTPEELEQQCSLVPVDSNGDGTPDSTQLSCEVMRSPCVGNEKEGVCLRVPEVRAGDIVRLVGYNFWAEAQVVIQSTTPGGPTRTVEAQVCGDDETPVSETVDGVQRDITDSRVNDRLAFVVPPDLSTGIYRITVVEENTSGVGQPGQIMSNPQFIRVVAPPDTTYAIASKMLFAMEQTSGEWGSDEVGIRVLSLPINLDDSVGQLREEKFRFGDVDTGESRDMARVLFEGNNINGIAMAIIGHEIDSEKAYEEQVEGFIDAFVFVVKEIWAELGTGAAATAIKKLVSGLSGWAIAIAAAVAAAIVIFAAMWAPADLLIEDVLGFTSIDLDELTSANYPAPPPGAHTSEGGIDVSVTTEIKDVELHERRSYRSDSEDSRYDITLRYNRLS